MCALPKPDIDKIVDLPVDQLRLDTENPRLAWRLDGDSQEKLARILWTEMSVDEVAWSIAENGFFRSEPLFVIIADPEETNPKKREYIVIEGNRRLTAVLLLRDDKLRKKLNATKLPDIDSDRRTSLDQLPAIVYKDRESLWTTVGFRHINGIKAWDSFSKAEYVANVHENYGVSLDEIADRIGDRHDTVKRLYRGIKILEQAEQQGIFAKEDRTRNRFYFSHLYTAVDQKEFQDFLGIERDSSLSPHPVPGDRLGELGELMTWLYGKKSQGTEPVVRKQNPDLNSLRRIIGVPESLSALRKGYSLDRSFDIAIGDKQRFRDALTSAKIELQTAQSTVVTGYFGDEDLYRLIRDINLLGNSVLEDMDAKRQQIELEQVDHVAPSSARRRK